MISTAGDHLNRLGQVVLDHLDLLALVRVAAAARYPIRRA